MKNEFSVGDKVKILFAGHKIFKGTGVVVKVGRKYVHVKREGGDTIKNGGCIEFKKA